MAETIISLDYAASRLAFFEEQKKLHQQKLHWWKHQKPYKQYDAQTIHEKCSYHGEAICYLEDAINALKEPVRHGKWEYECYKTIWYGAGVPPEYRCSVCDDLAYNTHDYCPNCGAKMDLK